MFTDMMKKRNPALVKAAAALHQNGSIPPNTYVIDLDSFCRNVQSLSRCAKEHDLQLYYMTKQIGRSGYIGQVIEKNGISKAVAVDIDEAFNLKKAGCQIGNVGHLVQPGNKQWKEVLTKICPEVITLFSLERAEQLSEAALSLGKSQNVILRVISEHDVLYPGQHGGFPLNTINAAVPELLKLPGINVTGLTSFPVLQLNKGQTGFDFTMNLETLKKAREIMEDKGVRVTHINAPGSTSCFTIPFLKEHGITHGEPGHAMTGTTPLHAYTSSLQETPCLVYVSEISHMDDYAAYTIAGGFYARSNMEKAFYGNTPQRLLKQETSVQPPSYENIDYYGSLEKNDGMNVGDSVIYAFRSQIFVTRSHVAFIQRTNSHSPEVVHFQRRGM
ncbi:alanine racemase [Fictibacillus enclensis]|uniref:alanine racemase n=1 Tax=Fictibacillus enclensis TaxID=1017270 RepID=UPI0024C01E39|nr:alanine racemase [Fictibacillus enclensis]WHY70098.1 alanine racemase [Fictibacillus enclensis]